ncbi:arylamine N-acetyltransferase family protein [Zooshikella ganghwensis]|uniref:arylamine N-acetyltransferase family protein n=1 Tax=Zooshikella ganghwensis TaxID=202772 RepID=UPI0004098D69|nr:arylamine N-acetyltransferase [Zooshikella ganghwensis]
MDSSNYLRRIGCTKEQPTLTFLRKLHQAHLQQVPFENLNVIYSQPIELKLPWLYQKIVLQQRGGFCFELNGLFGWLLSELGYRVSLVAAEVYDEKQNEFTPPFDHLALLVNLEQPWLVDVGFGDSFRSPLPLLMGKEHTDISGCYRLQQKEGFWVLEMYTQLQWLPRYRFHSSPVALSDFTERCHYHQTSFASKFKRNLLCSKALVDGRITLHDTTLIKTNSRGTKVQTPVDQLGGVNAVFKKYFSFDVLTDSTVVSAS